MNSINVSGLIAGILSIGSIAAVASGHAAIATVISTPEFTQAAIAFVGSTAALVSMFSSSVIKKG